MSITKSIGKNTLGGGSSIQVDKVTFPFHKGYHILYFKRVIEATAPSAKKK